MYYPHSICEMYTFSFSYMVQGILDPLVLMSRSEDNEILREVTAAINCLSSVEENKIEVCERYQYVI
jgi:hypothetical protein